MNSTDENRVDVGRIMEDIKREIDTKGLFDELPAFGQVSMVHFQIPEGSDSTGLRHKVQSAMANCAVSAVYPVEGGLLKRLFKKASQKATRCSIGPLSLRVTETNTSIFQCLDYAATIIEQQQQQIAELNEKLESIGNAVNGEVNDR